MSWPVSAWPDGRVFWWRERQGLLCLWENDEYQPPCSSIALAASDSADLPALLMDARRYIHQYGQNKILWNACLTPQMDAILASAGFARENDDSNYEYERTHHMRT
jgi:hypothetical protein